MSLDKLKHITCFIFDVDGVLTDGRVLVLPDGLLARSMNIKDGYALQLAVKKGYRVVVISGSNSPEVKARLNKLGVHEVHMQVIDKAALLRSIMDQAQLPAEACLYMGDDIPDLQVMQLTGFPCCPSDAVPEIKAVSVYIAQQPGGAGCVRDVIEKAMKLRGDWNEDVLVPAQ